MSRTMEQKESQEELSGAQKKTTHRGKPRQTECKQTRKTLGAWQTIQSVFFLVKRLPEGWRRFHKHGQCRARSGVQVFRCSEKHQKNTKQTPKNHKKKTQKNLNTQTPKPVFFFVFWCFSLFLSVFLCFSDNREKELSVSQNWDFASPSKTCCLQIAFRIVHQWSDFVRSQRPTETQQRICHGPCNHTSHRGTPTEVPVRPHSGRATVPVEHVLLG